MLFDSLKEPETPQAPQADASEVPSYALPTPFFSLALIAINILIFLAMLLGTTTFSPSSREMITWGAIYGPITVSGQWWRLLTACFLHFGFFHLAMNMFILFQVGPFTERLFGNWRFLMLYLFAGIGGNIVGLFIHPLSVSAGASGAIFGVYGGLLGFLLVERGVVPTAAAMAIAKSAGIFLLYNLFFGLASPTTDLIAHGAGLVVGFIVGCIFAHPLHPVRPLQYSMRALGGVVGVIALMWFASSHLAAGAAPPNDWNLRVLESPSLQIGDKDQLVYSGAATKEDAEKLGKELTTLGFFKRPNILVLFTKLPGHSSLSIPLKGDDTPSPTAATSSSNLIHGEQVATQPAEKSPPLAWANPLILAQLNYVGPQLASAAGGLPFSIRLLNGKGDLKKEIEITSTAVGGGLGRVLYSGQATADQAQLLLKTLNAAGYFADFGSLVLLEKSASGTIISFVVNPKLASNPRMQDGLNAVSRKVALSVSGSPLRVQLVDLSRNVIRELDLR